MILIVSEENEPTTDIIIRWIKSMNKSYVRINDTDIVKVEKFELCNSNINFSLVTRGLNIKYSEIEAFYFRRGLINLKNQLLNLSEISSYGLKQCLLNEVSTLQDFIHLIFEQSKKSIGIFNKRSVNKLEILYKAVEIGINIPNTLIVNNKSDLKKVLFFL